MTSRSSSWTRGAVLVTAGALAVALLPAAAASATTPLPAFSYLSSTGAAASPNLALATGDATGAGSSALTPAGVQVYGYDVSPDGNTTLVAARTGAPTTNAYDSTFGLAVVRRDPGTGTSSSALLSVFWDANPVLASNGTKAFWFYRGTLYEWDAAAGGLQPARTGFAPAPGEVVTRLAVSGDGSHVAVLYTNATARTARVLAAPLATGASAGNLARISYGPGGIQPSSNSFVWDGADTLIWSQYDSAVPGAATSTVSVTLPTDGSTATTATPRPALNGFYDLRQDVNGAWWTWNDSASGTVLSSVGDPLVDTPVQAAAPRGDGASTYRYTPSAASPPALQPVVNPAGSHAYLKMSASVVAYGRKVAYSAYNYYGGLPGTSYAWNRAAEVDRGYLQRSIDGVHWYTATTTSGAHPIVIGSSYYNAYYAKVLTRNTWFRWLYPGDLFTARGTSSTRLVKVVPVVSARVAVSGRSRIVYGAASRVGGAVVLYRKAGTRWVKVGVAAISSKGVYTFGKRPLPRGSYRIVTVADRYWASGYKILTF